MVLPRYVILDLSTGKTQEYPIDEKTFIKHLGGKILGAKILTDITSKGVDPLGEESVVIINTGAMNDTGAPSANRFNMTFKNVMTGGIASSNCGGQFGVMMKRAGVDGLILKGKAAQHTAIKIVDGDIKMSNADSLWGLDTEKTQEALPKKYGKLVIGVAGENLVRYACAVSGERVAGRCGSGAVLGAKNIKAIVAYGTKRPEAVKPEALKKYLQKWTKALKKHPMTGSSLPLYGSAGLVNKANASGALPTHNFKSGVYAKADNISGETLADKYLVRNSGCVGCPVRCERRVMVKGKEVKGPEYETIGLFGANIDNDDLALINEINLVADKLGLDTISLAVTMAFAMELKEKGMADFGLVFGKTDNLIEIITKIAYREGIYTQLADGSAIMSKGYSMADFAMHSKGLELASYEPRRSVGMGLGYATSNRGGCHLNGGYLALMESVGVISMDAQTSKGKPELTIMFQNLMEAVSAAGFCLFSLQTTVPAFMFATGESSFTNRIAGSAMLGTRKILGAMWRLLPWLMPVQIFLLAPQCKAIELSTGIKMTTGEFFQIGERGYNIERLYNLREGLTSSDDSLPKRLTDEPQQKDKANTVVNLKEMLPVYYKVRGWDKNGIPTAEKLQKLGINS